jgi:hypothetical protein
MMAMEQEDKKDLKRACVLLSKVHEVVRSGYSRSTGAAAKAMDRDENLGNPNRVSWDRQENNTDRQADRVGLVSRVNQNSSMDQRADRVSRVGSTEQKTRGSSWVANTESRLWRIWLTWNSRLQKIWLTWKAGLHRIWLTRKARLHRIWLTRKARLRKIRLTRKTRLCKTQGAGNQKNEKVLLQAKGQLHAGAQGVLPRQKCKLEKMRQ